MALTAAGWAWVAAAVAQLSHAAQPSAPAPNAAPLRTLPWGQLNFLHTTDTHGWHGGHLQEPNYSADWGDYVSFASHLRKRADDDGVDLLVIDTGDRIEGNGLYDAADPKGLYTFDIVKQQSIDIVTCGNHELYKANASDNEYFQTVPSFKGNYLASNIDIRDNETQEFIPLAQRYKKFTTKNQGIRVIAFGFLFNFQGSSNNTVVTPVQDAIKQDWFQDAIRDTDVDIFIVAGHVGLRMEEFKIIYNAIRNQRYDIPIHFFGGHTHIRDYIMFDSKAYGLESGRYMETVGFASVSGLPSSKSAVGSVRKSPNFQRLYVDNNLYSYHGHTGRNSSNFPTDVGLNVTRQIAVARKALDLDHTYGCAPQDLWLNRVEPSSKQSVFTWLQNEVLPDTFGKNGTPKFVITNTGTIRFDVFKGRFTRDSTFQVSPFTSGFHVLKAVSYDKATKILEVINKNGQILEQSAPLVDTTLLRPPEPAARHVSHRKHVSLFFKYVAGSNKDIVPGYTTHDDAGTEGDDTVHSEIQFFATPNAIGAEVDFGSNTPKKVDLVYNEFIEPWVLLALQFLGSPYDKEDAIKWQHGKSLTDMITDWVQQHWPCKKQDGLSWLEDL